MKIYFIITLLAFASFAEAQSLKDSLYGGKLKNTVGQTSVSKDTGKYVAPPVTKNAAISSQPGESKKTDPAEATKPNESMPDSLNKLYYSKQKLWKRFIESNVTMISAEAESTRKVKKGEYAIEIEYEIGLNGRVTTNNITCNPHNEFLIEKTKEMMTRPPVLAPPIYSDGKPRKATQTQPITIVKK
jgi:hypothetical protein